jgi:hypothetical protein
MAKFILLVVISVQIMGCIKDFGEDECFSPTKNLGSANVGSSNGCKCNSKTDASVCANGGVALVCEDDRWISVIDGPCSPMPRPYIEESSSSFTFLSSSDI